MLRVPPTLRSITAALLLGSSLAISGCQGGIPGLTLPPGLFPRAAMSQDQVEQAVRGMFRDSRIDDLQIEAHTLRSANETHGFNWQDPRISQDVPVYVATVRGRLKPIYMAKRGLGATIGASELWTEEVIMLLGGQDGQMMAMTGKPFIQENPGFTIRPETKDMWHLGDRLTFFTRGEPVEGTFTLTLTNKETGERKIETIAFSEAPDYALPLDADHLPGYRDVPLQSFELSVDISDGRHETKSRGEVRILRDSDVLAPPPTPVTGPDTGSHGPGSWAPSGTSDGLETFARQIAEQMWQGQGLTMTTRMVGLADLQPPSHRAGEVPAETKLHQFEFRGTFPKFLVPAIHSGTGAESVMMPTTLRVVLAETQPIQVVQTVAFE